MFVSLELFNSPIATLDLNLPSTQEVKEVKKVRRKVLRPVAVTSHSGFLLCLRAHDPKPETLNPSLRSVGIQA